MKTKILLTAAMTAILSFTSSSFACAKHDKKIADSFVVLKENANDTTQALSEKFNSELHNIYEMLSHRVANIKTGFGPKKDLTADKLLGTVNNLKHDLDNYKKASEDKIVAERQEIINKLDQLDKDITAYKQNHKK